MLAIFKSATPEALAEIAEEMRVRETRHFILLFSMGSQFDHLIVQQLVKLGVFAVVADPSKVTADDVKKAAPAGIILSGGPVSVAYGEPPPFDSSIFDLGIPTLGICLGFQMWAAHVGAKVSPQEKREFGVHTFSITARDPLFDGVSKKTQVLESHGDSVENPRGVASWVTLGSTENAPVAAARYKHLVGVQFHPEVSDTTEGAKIYENFVGICGITDRFPAHSVAEHKVEELKRQIADKKVLIAVSGGSDSSVVGYLVKAAVPKNPRGVTSRIRGVYIRGIDRPDDEAYVKKYFGNENWIDLKIVDATNEFLAALKGKTEMRDKRIAMQDIYHDVLEKEIKEFGADFVAQGTLYTDLRESGRGHATGAEVAEIKVHHNVGI